MPCFLAIPLERIEKHQVAFRVVDSFSALGLTEKEQIRKLLQNNNIQDYYSFK